MAVAGPRDQIPRAEHRQSLADTLSEFAIEDLDRTEVRHRIADVSSPISVMASPYVALGTRREAHPRWFVGAALLVVGFLAGFAIGVAIATRSGGEQKESSGSFATDRGNSGQQGAELLATSGRSSAELIAKAMNDEPRMTEPERSTAEPESINSLQRPVSPPVSAKASSVLYVQSRPAGAQVHLDDRLVSTTPFQLSGVTPGPHTIRVELQGYRTWSTAVSIEAGSRVRIAASLEQ